jgi:carboxylesterase
MLIVLLGAAVLILAVATTLSRRAALRLRDETLQRLPVGGGGIIAGAQGFELRRGAEAPAVLLLHGGGDTPQTLRYLAEYANARGYNVRVPLLPGHGRTLREFSTVTADEWMQAVRTAYHELTEAHGWVGVVGLSMGGALAAQLAADDETLPALVLLAPYLAMPGRVAIGARFSNFWGFAVPYVRALDPAGPRSILDEAEATRSLAYGVFTPAALRALRNTVSRAVAALPSVRTPTLMIQSRDDNRIPPAIAQRAFDRIGARDKKLVWVTGAGHVITVDYGREHVFELVVEWLDRHGVAAARERRA